MATYPDLGAEEGSTEDWADPILISVARGGGARARRLQPAKKMVFRVVHWLTTAEKATLEAFFNSNRAATFQFVWIGTGLTYTVIFADEKAMSFKPRQADNWEVTVLMREV